MTSCVLNLVLTIPADRIQLVQGTPDTLNANPTPLFLDTFAVYSALIKSAKHTIRIVHVPTPHHHHAAASDWTAWQWPSIIGALHEAHSKRNVTVQVVRSASDVLIPIHTIEFNRNSSIRDDELTIIGSSVWIVDDRDAFVRATDGTQTIGGDNLGIWLSECPDLVADLRQTVLWENVIADDKQTPTRRVRWNSRLPVEPGWLTDTFFARLPRKAAPKNDSPVTEMLLASRRFVDIALVYESKAVSPLWPTIEAALQTMAGQSNNVTVRLLLSYNWFYDRSAAAFGQHFLHNLKQLALERPDWHVQFVSKIRIRYT